MLPRLGGHRPNHREPITRRSRPFRVSSTRASAGRPSRSTVAHETSSGSDAAACSSVCAHPTWGFLQDLLRSTMWGDPWFEGRHDHDDPHGLLPRLGQLRASARASGSRSSVIACLICAAFRRPNRQCAAPRAGVSSSLDEPHAPSSRDTACGIRAKRHSSEWALDSPISPAAAGSGSEAAARSSRWSSRPALRG
jgi:hypothetical protein